MTTPILTAEQVAGCELADRVLAAASTGDWSGFPAEVEGLTERERARLRKFAAEQHALQADVELERHERIAALVPGRDD